MGRADFKNQTRMGSGAEKSRRGARETARKANTHMTSYNVYFATRLTGFKMATGTPPIGDYCANQRIKSLRYNALMRKYVCHGSSIVLAICMTYRHICFVSLFVCIVSFPQPGREKICFFATYFVLYIISPFPPLLPFFDF